MKRHRKTSVAFLFLLTLLLSAGISHADPIRLNAIQNDEVSDSTSIHQAVQAVKERYPESKVLGASTTQGPSGKVHQIKIITRDGVIKQIRVPANPR